VIDTLAGVNQKLNTAVKGRPKIENVMRKGESNVIECKLLAFHPAVVMLILVLHRPVVTTHYLLYLP